MDKKYIIKYKILLKNASPLLNKEIKINNCMSELHAQIKLEEYLKRKYINFDKLVVESVKEDFILNNIFSGNNFNDIFNMFKK